MDKRSYSLVSPKKAFDTDNCKKLKVSVSPKVKYNENNGNTLNLHIESKELEEELNDLCFEDDDDEFFKNVSFQKLPGKTKDSSIFLFSVTQRQDTKLGPFNLQTLRCAKHRESAGKV